MAVGRTQRSVAMGRRGPGADAVTDARVLALLARHEQSLMRVARQWSLCQDDAFDAFQRGLEIYVRRIATVECATEAAWLKVVIRHEALAIRRARSDCAVSDVDLDATIPSAERGVEEQVLSSERVSRSAEALRRLKPDEARALMLKAHGLSYEEIARRCGWTYTKVNRAITEGRRRFMDAYGALESGEECERFAPALRALAAGTASSQELVEVRPHLRGCSACRALVRDLHASGVRPARVLVPLPALAAPLRWVRERIRHYVSTLLQRADSSDVAGAIHALSTSGGGRGVATLGALLGLCLSGVGAGTVCVVTGVVEAPFGLFEERHGAVVHKTRPRASVHRHRPSHARSAPRPSADRVVRAAAVPTASATPIPSRRRVTPKAVTPSTMPAASATTPPSPATPPSQGTPTEFGPEPTPSPAATGNTREASSASFPRASVQRPTTTKHDAVQQEFGP